MKQKNFTKTELELLKNLEIFPQGETVTNPYSGKSVYLEPEAVALYDLIKGAEVVNNTKLFNRALTMFRKYWPNEYMVLLD